MTTRSEKSQSLIHQQQPNTNNKNNRLLHNRSIDSSPSQLVDHMTTSKAVAFCWNKVHQKHSLGNRSTTNICTPSTDWLLHNETLTSRKRNRRRPTINLSCLQHGKYTLHFCHCNGNKTKANCVGCCRIQPLLPVHGPTDCPTTIRSWSKRRLFLICHHLKRHNSVCSFLSKRCNEAMKDRHLPLKDDSF